MPSLIGTMPETKQISLAEIDPPSTPARMAMDDTLLAELRGSMERLGLLQAIGVVSKDGRYEIVYGHRRYTCANDLQWITIECKVYHPSELAEGAAMLAENRYHEELTAAEEALLFQEHRELYGLDEQQLCERFQVTPDYLGDRFRLLRGDKRVFDALAARQIKFAVARELNKCEDEAHRRYLLDLAIRCGYPARVVSDQIREWRQQSSLAQAVAQPSPPADPPPPAPEYKQECILCGGYRDPWNLRSVLVHEAELQVILKSLENAAKDVG